MDRIGTKIDRLNHILFITKPHFVVLTEHGLHADTILNVKLNNYDIAAAFGRRNHIKGGVAIFKSSFIDNITEEIVINEHNIEMVFETAAVKVKLHKNNWLYLIGLYRPPSASLDEGLLALDNLLDSLPIDNNSICMVGDFNVDCLCGTWEKERENNKLKEVLTSYNINRTTLPPTRITKNSVSSIDLFCSNMPVDYANIEIMNTGISDHTGQYCKIKIPSKIKAMSTTTKRSFNNQNLKRLKDLLGIKLWNGIKNAKSAEEACSEFINTISVAIEITCPEKTYRSLNNNKYFDSEAMAFKKCFLEAQQIYLRTGNEEDKLAANTSKKMYDQKLISLRKNINAQKLYEASNKSKAVWDIINSERASKKQSSTISSLNINGEKVEDSSQLANQLNNYFSSIAEKTLQNNRLHPAARRSFETNAWMLDSNLEIFKPTTSEEINSILSALKPTLSSGIDNIPSRVLKYCKEELSHPLTLLINKSMAEGIFPSSLKIAKVYPLHKHNSKEEIKNYRPISLLPTVSKIFEKIVLKRLIDHLTQNDLLNERQHGFISGRSTNTALADLVEFIINNLDMGNTVSSTFLDLSKAFDCLGHDLILLKLETLGVRGVAAEWFRSYLSNRSQLVELRVITNGNTKTVTSERQPMERGVPQGSVLGPVLFVLFTLDLPRYVEDYSYAVMFADDTVLLTSDSSAEQLEIKSFISITLAQQYCHENDLVFNETKTKQLTLGRKKEDLTTLSNLQQVSTTKHLGVIIDNNLSWSYHVEYLCSKLGSALYAIRRTKTVSTEEAARVAYYALFESHLRYGTVVWGGTSRDSLQRVLVLQKRAVRMLAGLKTRDSCRDAFKLLRILTVPSLYIMEVIMYAVQKNLPRFSHIHQHSTRRTQDFKLPAHRLALFQKKPSYAGARYFNALPKCLKNSPPTMLKKKLKEWFIDKAFYTIDEFLFRNYDRN